MGLIRRGRSMLLAPMQPGGNPAITSKPKAASATLRANGPMWSSVSDSGHTPARLTASCVPLNPTIPQPAAGVRNDPPVAVPRVTAESPAATAPPDPPLDPPGI